MKIKIENLTVDRVKAKVNKIFKDDIAVGWEVEDVDLPVEPYNIMELDIKHRGNSVNLSTLVKIGKAYYDEDFAIQVEAKSKLNIFIAVNNTYGE